MKNKYLYATLFIMFLILINNKINNTRLLDSEKINQFKIESLNKKLNQLKKQHQIQSQVNLLLRSYINDSEERKLKKDTAYLNLIETL